MLPADFLIKLANLLTSSKMAVRVSFMIMGAIISMMIFFPYLQGRLPQPTKAASDFTSELCLLLAMVLGACMGVVILAMISWCLNLAHKCFTAAVTWKNKKSMVKRQELARQFEDQAFMNEFKTVYPQLDQASRLVLHSLNRKQESYYVRADGIHYLTSKRWIIPKSDLPNNYFIYEIDSRISVALKEIEMEKTHNNSMHFIESEKKGCKAVLVYFLSSPNPQHPYPINKRDFLQARLDYNCCFNVQSANGQPTLSFLPGYHSFFEAHFQMKMPSKIILTLTDKGEPIH
ncbi:Uncharacterised protein [Enterobacter cloacae]|nr:Uncharacterised protein [Enterobacter cloacae]HBH7064229.1 hypothetical protein [Enterobacter cloacae]